MVVFNNREEMKDIKGIGKWRFVAPSAVGSTCSRTSPDFLLPATNKLRLSCYVVGDPLYIDYKGIFNNKTIKANIQMLRIAVQRKINQKCHINKVGKEVRKMTQEIRVYKLYSDDSEVVIGSFIRQEDGFLNFIPK
jgi:hypothetical protein